MPFMVHWTAENPDETVAIETAALLSLRARADMTEQAPEGRFQRGFV